MTRTGLILWGIGSLVGSEQSFGHGVAHAHRETAAVVEQSVVDSDLPASFGERRARTSGGEKSFAPVEESGRIWGGTLSTSWASRHVHYGVDETGPGGAYTTELGFWIQNFTFNVWSGFGTGNDFQEWDFTASYRFELGPVYFLPGYNLRFSPSYGHSSHAEEEDDHHEEHEEDEHEEHDHGGHSHRSFGNELFLVVGTDRIPYVNPSMTFVSDLNNAPGGMLVFRVDGDIPVVRDVLSLQPYALLGVNFGYNTDEYYGWNNFQFGLEATWRITRGLSVFGGVNYSVAMTALREINEGNTVWANGGVSFSF